MKAAGDSMREIDERRVNRLIDAVLKDIHDYEYSHPYTWNEETERKILWKLVKAVRGE